MTRSRPSTVAAATTDRDWEVRRGIWDRDGEGRVIGFIAEFGGVYEVEKLTGTKTHEYFASFKEAMECFEAEG